MTTWAWLPFVLAGACALMLIVADRLSTPKLSDGRAELPDHRGVGVLMSAFVALTGYVFLYALTERPWTAAALGTLLIGLLWAGNRLKAKLLAEPLVFSDVFLAGHALRYPHLYFGYAPLWVWPLIAAFLASLAAVCVVEPPFVCAARWQWAGGALLLWVVFIGGICFVPLFRKPFLSVGELSFDANQDAKAYSPIGAALMHCAWHAEHRTELRNRFRRRDGKTTGSGPSRAGAAFQAVATLPVLPKHIILIQAESFCRLDLLLNRPCAVPSIARLMEEGRSGSLTLDWRGAYTMRSEFAVLTGCSPRVIETYGFDPYRLAAIEPMTSLVWTLRERGYQTEAWHPNDGRFFERCRVMPNLGFERFLDLKALDDFHQKMCGQSLPRFGRYVNDAGLLSLAAKRLENEGKPTFLFIVTMEAHGPWHEDAFPGAETLSETERYEAHLKQLDQGVLTIAEEIRAGKLDAGLMLYGDHLPGLEELSSYRGDADTSWFGWQHGLAHGERRLRPEMLEREVLRFTR